MLIVDGYNVLFQCGFISRGIGPQTLERARGALLGILNSRLDETGRAQTTVVFDATELAAGLPDETVIGGIRVYYSHRYADADSMIEELIAHHSAPKQLVVVSSDRRIQRAARRRKATAIDSEQWFDQVISSTSGEQAETGDDVAGSRQEFALTSEEIQIWVNRFRQSRSDTRDNADVELDDSLSNDPFPPGYADDLMDDTGDVPDDS